MCHLAPFFRVHAYYIRTHIYTHWRRKASDFKLGQYCKIYDTQPLLSTRKSRVCPKYLRVRYRFFSSSSSFYGCSNNGLNTSQPPSSSVSVKQTVCLVTQGRFFTESNVVHGCQWNKLRTRIYDDICFFLFFSFLFFSFLFFSFSLFFPFTFYF